MSITVHRQDPNENFEYEDLNQVRADLATGRLQAADLLWDPVRETWVPLADVTGGPAAGRASAMAGPGIAPAAATASRAAMPSGMPAQASPAFRRFGHPTIWAAVAVGAALVVTALLLVRSSSPPAGAARDASPDQLARVGSADAAIATSREPDTIIGDALGDATTDQAVSIAELNRLTAEERKVQEQLAQTGGNTAVEKVYRSKWESDRDNPMALFLYLRYADPPDEESLLRECTSGHREYAWCWLALAVQLKKEKRWEEALTSAVKAASLFDHPVIRAAKGDCEQCVAATHYSHWLGNGVAALRCSAGYGDFEIIVYELARGCGCPRLWRGTDSVTLCYKAYWRAVGRDRVFNTALFKMWLDDGSSIAPKIYDEGGSPVGWQGGGGERRGDEGRLILIALVPPQRTVRAVGWLLDSSCDGGAGDFEPVGPPSRDAVDSHGLFEIETLASKCRLRCGGDNCGRAVCNATCMCIDGAGSRPDPWFAAACIARLTPPACLPTP